MALFNFNPSNPIAVREMKSRMRGPRTFGLLGVYTALMALFIYVVYLRKGATAMYSYGGSTISSNFGPTRNFETGQDIFIAIFLYLLVVTAILTPAICSGLVSREIEEGTYDLLMVTPVRGRTLIYGKLLAALAYIMMLVLASVPLACIVFIFGGVKPDDLFEGYCIVLMQTIALGIISLFFSGLFRRTSLAVIATYGVVVLLLLGVPIASNSIVAAINNDTGRLPPNVRVDPRTDPAFDLPKRMLVFNSFAALGSVLAPNSPYRPNATEEIQYFPNSKLFWGNPANYYATPTFRRNDEARQANELAKLPVLPGGYTLWQGYVLVFTAISLFFLILSMGVIKPQPRRSGFNPFTRLSRLGKLGPRRSKKEPAGAAAVSTLPGAAPEPTLLDILELDPARDELAVMAASESAVEPPPAPKRVALG